MLAHWGRLGISGDDVSTRNVFKEMNDLIFTEESNRSVCEWMKAVAEGYRSMPELKKMGPDPSGMNREWWVRSRKD